MKYHRFLVYIFLVFVFFLFAAQFHDKAYAQDVSISVQQWSFFNNKNFESISGSGQHVSLGSIWGIDTNLEAGFGIISMVTPRPADTLMGYISFGYSLLEKRWINEKIPPNWINSQIEAGFIGGIKNLYSFSAGSQAEGIAQIFIKITPLVLGNPFYFRRDKLLSLGLAYDCIGDTFSLYINLVGFDFRILPK